MELHEEELNPYSEDENDPQETKKKADGDAKTYGIST